MFTAEMRRQLALTLAVLAVFNLFTPPHTTGADLLAFAALLFSLVIVAKVWGVDRWLL